MSKTAAHKAAWAAHRAKTSGSATAGQVATPSSLTNQLASNQDAIWQAACKADWDSLKTIPDHAVRNLQKPKMLDKYRDYLDDWTYAHRCEHLQNDVLVRNLIWAMDCGQYHYGVELADACITTGQVMTLMERTCTTFAADAVLQAAEALHRDAKPLTEDVWVAFTMVLGRLTYPDTDWKTNPFVLAKYHRLAAKLAKDTDPAAALEHALAAHTLDSNVGVKTLIADLTKQLNTSPPLQAGGAGDSGEVVSLPTPDDPTPVAPVLPIPNKDLPAG